MYISRTRKMQFSCTNLIIQTKKEIILSSINLKEKSNPIKNLKNSQFNSIIQLSRVFLTLILSKITFWILKMMCKTFMQRSSKLNKVKIFKFLIKLVIR